MFESKEKSEQKVAIVVTGRIQSKRLPAKIMQKIGGKKACEILFENLQRQKKFEVVLACPKNEDDDALVEVGREYGLTIYRGEDDSPMHRLFAAGKAVGADHVVRITCDDILIDAQILQQQVQFHVRGESDYTYISKIPDGCAGEVISMKALSDAVRRIGDKPVEFTSYYLRRPDRYTVKDFYPPVDYRYNYRLTMDYPEDLTALRMIFACLSWPFSTTAIINLLKEKKYMPILDINKQPLISVYTCTYNQSEYVVESLESILKHQLPANQVEIVVIDDASTDGTPGVITEWISSRPDLKIRYVRNKKNIGLAASSNLAAHICRGKYIVRLDSDDLIDAEFLYRMRTALDENHNWSAVWSDYRRISHEGKVINENVENKAFHPACAMLRRGALLEILYKEDMEHFEGQEFFERFKQYFGYGRIEEPLWSYREHGQSKTFDPGPAREKQAKAMR